jgi:hypothetical protein
MDFQSADCAKSSSRNLDALKTEGKDLTPEKNDDRKKTQKTNHSSPATVPMKGIARGAGSIWQFSKRSC